MTVKRIIDSSFLNKVINPSHKLLLKEPIEMSIVTSTARVLLFTIVVSFSDLKSWIAVASMFLKHIFAVPGI